MLVFFASWVMMLIGRVRIRELVKLLGLAFAAVMLAGLLNLGRSETAGGRVETWIDLWTKPQTEKPIDQLTDTERSMIAIHNGGILGEGAGQSAMRVEMIHPESDYAYAFSSRSTASSWRCCCCCSTCGSSSVPSKFSDGAARHFRVCWSWDWPC